MRTEYAFSCFSVNNYRCLPKYKQTCNLPGMSLAERLALAMEHAGLNQPQLAEKAKVNQQNISKILLGKQKRSTDTVKLAIACGVRAEWLSEGLGEMSDGLYIHDEKLKHLFQVCQQLPGYDVDRLVQAGDALKELNDKNVKP